MKLFTSILIFLQIFLLSTVIFAGETNFTMASRAKTLSLNGLYFAGTDGLQSILGNPSMLSQLSSKGIELFIVDHIGQHEYENLQGDLFKSFQDDDFSFGGGIFWALSPAFTAALSYQRAIDYKVNWPFANLFSTDSSSSLLAFDFYNQITVDAASASFASSINQFSIGASANFYFIEQHTAFPRSNERWNQGLGLAGYQFNYNQDGYSFGFNLGASLQINNRFRVGVMTRSGFKADLEGTAESNMFAQLDSASSSVDLSGTFELPWIFGAGLNYEWTENLRINLDVQYSLWNGIQKTFDLTFENATWQQNLSSRDSLTDINSSSFNFYFKNSIDAGLGVEFSTSDLVLRGGYRFSQSPNSDNTYNLFFPSVDQHYISFGIGYRDESLIVDASLAYVFGLSKEVIKPVMRNSSGNYSSTLILPNITFRYLL